MLEGTRSTRTAGDSMASKAEPCRASRTPSGPAASATPESPKLAGGIQGASPRLRPCEAGGLPMLEMAKVIIEDAARQEYIVEELGQVLDASVDQEAVYVSTKGTCETSAASFESSSPCPLKPSEYLKRMLKYTKCSPCNFVIGVIYLQRLKEGSSGGALRLTPFNIQRLLLTAIMLASKTHDDYFVSNTQWALVGDLHLSELNVLEIEMLYDLKFSMTVTREEYDVSTECLNLIKKHGAAKQQQRDEEKLSQKTFVC